MHLLHYYMYIEWAVYVQNFGQFDGLKARKIKLLEAIQFFSIFVHRRATALFRKVINGTRSSGMRLARRSGCFTFLRASPLKVTVMARVSNS